MRHWWKESAMLAALATRKELRDGPHVARAVLSLVGTSEQVDGANDGRWWRYPTSCLVCAEPDPDATAEALRAWGREEAARRRSAEAALHLSRHWTMRTPEAFDALVRAHECRCVPALVQSVCTQK